MSSCLECFCCCFYPSVTPTTTQNNQNLHAKKKKTKPQPKKSRIITKYKKQQIIQLTKQQKRKGNIVYTCPICTNLYSKILACEQCENSVCRQCIEAYEKKYILSKDDMKCPFCASDKSHFIDYEKQAHSYFDTTNQNGFLDASERKKIDEEMKKQQKSKLSIINEEEPTNLVTIPTINQLQSIQMIESQQNSQNQNQHQHQHQSPNLNQESNVILVNRNQQDEEALSN